MLSKIDARGVVTTLTYDELNRPLTKNFSDTTTFERTQRVRWSHDLYFRSDAQGRPVVSQHLISVDYRDTRLEEVLNDVVGQMRNYSWEIDDEVVNVFPVRDRNPLYEKLMEVNISKFSSPEGLTIEWLPELLRKLPEFRTFREDYDLKYDLTQYTSFRRRELPEMSFTGLTFRHLLNSIVRVKRGAWIVRASDIDAVGTTLSILL